MTATRVEIVKEARSWLGTPWVHQGFDKTFGCDCIGLVRGVGILTGALNPHKQPKEAKKYLGYSRNPDPKQMRNALKTFFALIPVKEAIEGDILWFRIGVFPTHLGIITEPGIIIHADGVNKKVIEHRMATSRISFIVAAFKFPDILET